MPSIFDQHQPKSHLAQRLNEAFAGCDKWSVAPPRRRSVDMVPQPRMSDFTPRALDAPAWVQPHR